MALYIAVWFVLACIGGLIGGSKGLGGQGFFLGLLLGPLGILIIAVVGNGPKSKLALVETRPVAAGWFPDPLGRTTSRWFDGSQWTQHVGRIDSDGTRVQFEDPV
jgi:hypothetical protein